MLNVNAKSHWFKRYAVITLGSICYSIAIGLILDPNRLAPGGVTGIAIILNHLTNLPTGTLMLVMNVPLMIIGIWKFGLKFFLSTIYTIVTSSLMVNWLTANILPVTDDHMLGAVAGGALLALGMGLVYKAGATTGGSDIIVRLIKLKRPHIKTGKLFLCTDIVVVLASAIVFKNVETGIYAAIVVFLYSSIFDVVLYGADDAKLIYIVTDKIEDVKARLLSERIGITLLNGEGAYTHTQKQIVMCAVKKQLLPKVEDIVKDQDPMAFLIVTSASEIFGNGFKDPLGERL